MLNRDVGSGELSHRVVAVADEHPLVELFGTTHSDHVVISRRRPGQAVEARIRLVDELVEEDPPQALLGP